MAGCSSARSDDASAVASAALRAGGGAIRGLAGKCLDVRNAGDANGTQVQLWDCNGTDAQGWTFTSGTLVGLAGKCLDVRGDAQTSGTSVDLWDCNGTAAQQWSVDCGTGEIRSGGGYCLDVTGDESASGTPVQIWACGSHQANQTWSTAAPSCSAPTGAPDASSPPPVDGGSAAGPAPGGGAKADSGAGTDAGGTAPVASAGPAGLVGPTAAAYDDEGCIGTELTPSSTSARCAAGDIACLINGSNAGTFCLRAGTYPLSTPIAPGAGTKIFGKKGETVTVQPRSSVNGTSSGGTVTLGTSSPSRAVDTGNPGVIVAGLTFENFKDPDGTINVSGAGSVLRYCEVGNATVGPVLWSSGGTIEYNDVHGSETTGIGAYDVTSGTVHFNYTHGNNALRQDVYTAAGSAAGIKVAAVSHLQIANNWVEDNAPGEGIWLDVDSASNVITGNVVTGNLDGIWIEISEDNTVENNVVSGNQGAGITSISSSGTTITGNSVTSSCDSCGFIQVVCNDRPGGGDHRSIDNVVRGNSVYLPAGSDLARGGFVRDACALTANFPGSNTWDANVYHLHTLDAALFETPALPAAATFPQWQALSYDTSGTRVQD